MFKYAISFSPSEDQKHARFLFIFIVKCVSHDKLAYIGGVAHCNASHPVVYQKQTNEMAQKWQTNCRQNQQFEQY